MRRGEYFCTLIIQLIAYANKKKRLHTQFLTKHACVRTADHSFVGFDHVLNGDALGVLGVHHVDHLAQHVLELNALLALKKRWMK